MKKVVIVESSFFIRRHIAASLAEGFETHAAADAHQAMALIDRVKADWLLLNPNLSKNSGLELLCELQCWADLRSVKTILMTQDADYYARHKRSLQELNIRHVVPLASLEPGLLGSLMGAR